MPTPAGGAGKQPALISTAGEDQSRMVPAMCVQDPLDALAKQDHLTAYLNTGIKAFSDSNMEFACMLQPTVGEPTTKFSLGKGDGFPTERRPQKRALTTASMEEVNIWFEKSGITIGPKADTPERVDRARRLVYTYKDCFATTIREIKATDLLEHSIDLEDGAKPIKSSLPKYTQEERDFANQIFPEMEDAGIIQRRSSEWGARTKFPPKKKGSSLKRVVHNFIPVNKYTKKSGYPMHSLEEVVNTLMRAGHEVYMMSDAANSYWAVNIRKEDRNKTGFIGPNGQWVYIRMGQGLKGAPFTYSQFGDMVFGPLPPNQRGVPRMPTILGRSTKHAFQIFMDDHAGSAKNYETMFDFLLNDYFPRVAFGPIYLSGPKTNLFASNLELLGFEGDSRGIRPSLKHRRKILDWPVPQNRMELDAFLWLTPFLRIFIPGRSELVMEMKRAYLVQQPNEPKPRRPHDAEMEECDADLAKKPRAPKPKKPTIQRKWVEKDTFDWGEKQQMAFDAVKKAISTNAMSGADPDMQYHLATDASKTGLGGCLFQLHGTRHGTEATPKLLPNERIIFFMSYQLLDAETRYSNSERECYAIVRSLAEVRWLVVGSKYPVMVYTDHEALKALFKTGNTESGRIATWMDRLGEYDLKVFHRPSRDPHIGIADGLSRMPTRLLSSSRQEDSIRPAMKVTKVLVGASQVPDHQIQKPDHQIQRLSYPPRALEPMPDRATKYRESPMYHQLMEYLERGEAWLTDAGVSRSRRKALRNQAKFFQQDPDTKLLYFIETNGRRSICLVESEVQRFLKAAHEDHGHFASSLTLDYLIGRVYWPTRVKDVEAWVRSCHSCQTRLKKPIKSDAFVIQGFSPMTMIGMDFMGPISPACTATGAIYILLVVDYFTRFIWAKAYLHARGDAVIDMLRDHIAPVFGWPKGAYSDNGSHFVNDDVHAIYLEHGVSQFTGPVSSPSSTGLLERAVQMLLTLIAKSCVDRGTTNSWSLGVRDHVLTINTKATKIHGYQPAQLMLGFEPKRIHFDIEPTPIPDPVLALEALPNHQYHLHTALRSEARLLASEVASYTHAYKHARRLRRQRIPNVGDLVLVRDLQLDKQKGRKLDPKWLGPRILVKFTEGGHSAWVREVYGPQKLKRYHINDLIQYHERAQAFGACAVLPSPTMKSDMRITTKPGQRALVLTTHR